MTKEIIRCPRCGRVIRRTAWFAPPILVNEEEIEGKYWCVYCQEAFTFRSRAKVEGRSYTKDGYILIKVPLRGWVREHTYIWEKNHGIVFSFSLTTKEEPGRRILPLLLFLAKQSRGGEPRPIH